MNKTIIILSNSPDQRQYGVSPPKWPRFYMPRLTQIYLNCNTNVLAERCLKMENEKAELVKNQRKQMKSTYPTN